MFIDTLWRHYPRLNVAVWSSMKSHNLHPLVHKAFGARATELAFVWDQDSCTTRWRKDMHKPLLRKDLEWLYSGMWAHHMPDHVLLIDDDEIKCEANPQGTAVHPTSFEGDDADEELLRLAGYLEALAKSDCNSVPEFVLGNPFSEFE